MISNIDPNHFKVKHKKCNSKLNQTYFVFIKIQDLNSHAKRFLSNSRIFSIAWAKVLTIRSKLKLSEYAYFGNKWRLVQSDDGKITFTIKSTFNKLSLYLIKIKYTFSSIH